MYSLEVLESRNLNDVIKFPSTDLTFTDSVTFLIVKFALSVRKEALFSEFSL